MQPANCRNEVKDSAVYGKCLCMSSVEDVKTNPL